MNKTAIIALCGLIALNVYADEERSILEETERILSESENEVTFMDLAAVAGDDVPDAPVVVRPGDGDEVIVAAKAGKGWWGRTRKWMGDNPWPTIAIGAVAAYGAYEQGWVGGGGSGSDDSKGNDAKAIVVTVAENEGDVNINITAVDGDAPSAGDGSVGRSNQDEAK